MTNEELVGQSARSAAAANATERRVRAFFALPLPDELLRTIVTGQAALKKLAPGLRWTDESKLHLTLKFLGSVSESDVAELARGLERIATDSKPVPTRALGLDAFPTQRRARVLVLRLDDPSGVLAALADSLDVLAESFGVARETRAFKPHVTLARARPPADVQALLDAASRELLGLGPQQPTRLTRARLYQSTLSRAGSTYEVLHERLLGG